MKPEIGDVESESLDLQFWHLLATAAAPVAVILVAGAGAYIKLASKMASLDYLSRRLDAHGREIDSHKTKLDEWVQKQIDHESRGDQRDHDMNRRLDRLDAKIFNGHYPISRKEMT